MFLDGDLLLQVDDDPLRLTRLEGDRRRRWEKAFLDRCDVDLAAGDARLYRSSRRCGEGGATHNNRYPFDRAAFELNFDLNQGG
jgi:hypothetical protein